MIVSALTHFTRVYSFIFSPFLLVATDFYSNYAYILFLHFFFVQIGEGSYGAVYKAKSIDDGMLVAVKVLNMGDEQETADIQKEINILKVCDSKYIVRYKGTYSHEGKLFIAMEYCGVGSLSDLMAICEITLTEKQVAAVIKQSIRGLMYLHKSKKIHRDIKSGNILLTDKGECKLADFGVSAELTSTFAKRVTMIGTPYFMAPEVLQSNDYDAKADIWSIGITAYELAIGAPPHADVHPLRAIFVIPSSPPPTLPEDGNFSPEFKDFLRLCLQKSSDARPTAEQLLKHPFLANSQEEKVVLELVNQCRGMIEAYRDEEALYQQQQNENAPQQQTQGTIVRGAAPGATATGTMVGPSQSTWNYNDKTVVNAANKLRDAAGNTGTVVKNSSAFSNYGTVVSHDGPGSFSDYGTVVMRGGAEDPAHFGTIKMRKNGTTERGYDQGTVVSIAPTSVTSSGATTAPRPAGALVLNADQANEIMYKATFTKDKNKLSQSIRELEALYNTDVEKLNQFYKEKINTMKRMLERK